jgi:hypothetical protein
VSSADSDHVEFDVFISHAHENKDSFVRPLANALESRRLRAWYDEFTLRPGDSIRRSIDHGLLTSQARIAVLSPPLLLIRAAPTRYISLRRRETHKRASSEEVSEPAFLVNVFLQQRMPEHVSPLYLTEKHSIYS